MRHFESTLSAPLLSDLSVGGKPKERSRCGQRCVAGNATLTRKYRTDSFRATVTSFRSGFIGGTQVEVENPRIVGKRPRQQFKGALRWTDLLIWTGPDC